MDWFLALVAWFDAHPAGLSWWLAWLAALGVSQAVKSLMIPRTWEAERAVKITQTVAIVTGISVAWGLLENTPHRLILAIIIGLSAPTAYTLGMAIVRAFVPKLAHQLSWQGTKERKLSKVAKKKNTE